MISYVRQTRKPTPAPAGPISYRRPDRDRVTFTGRAATRVAHVDACRAWARSIDAAVGAAKGRPAPGTPPRVILQAGQVVKLRAGGAIISPV